ARGFHPFPFRTRKLSLSAPMVLHARVCGRVGRRPINPYKARLTVGFLLLLSQSEPILADHFAPEGFDNQLVRTRTELDDLHADFQFSALWRWKRHLHVPANTLDRRLIARSSETPGQ